MKIVDLAALDIGEIPELKTTDVIFICTPLDRIIPTIQAIAPHLNPNTIISDVGSVKSEICRLASTYYPRFVGGHPMAGTAFSGINAAQVHLFGDRPCVLMTSDDSKALEILKSLWQSVGAVIYECSPEIHDQAVAWISHLPILVSATLILAAGQESNSAIAQLAQDLASSGFHDTSRVGGGNPELGVLIAAYNQTPLLARLKQYQVTLADLIHQVEVGDWSNLRRSLTLAHELRNLYTQH